MHYGFHSVEYQFKKGIGRMADFYVGTVEFKTAEKQRYMYQSNLH